MVYYGSSLQIYLQIIIQIVLKASRFHTLFCKINSAPAFHTLILPLMVSTALELRRTLHAPHPCARKLASLVSHDNSDNHLLSAVSKSAQDIRKKAPEPWNQGPDEASSAASNAIAGQANACNITAHQHLTHPSPISMHPEQ